MLTWYYNQDANGVRIPDQYIIETKKVDPLAQRLERWQFSHPLR